MKRGLPFWLLLLCVLPLLLLTAWHVPLNQDEGWYLIAAQRVAQGHMPYRDFTHTQPPVLLYVYQLARPFVQLGGIYGARLFQALLLLLTGIAICTALLAALPVQSPTLTKRRLCLLSCCLLFLAPVHLQFSLTVKTYALAGLWLVLGAGCLLRNTRPRHWISAAIFFALAGGTRLPLLLFLPAIALDLLCRHRTLGYRPCLCFSITAGLTLALIFGPFLWQAPAALRFGLIDFHAARTVSTPWLIKAAFLPRVLLAWFPALLLLTLSLLFRARPERTSERTPTESAPLSRPLWWGLGLCTLAHLATPFPYDEYQTPLYPLLILLLVRRLAVQTPEVHHPRALAAAVLTCLMFFIASPQPAQWLPVTRDRIWFHTRPTTDLAQLRFVAHKVRSILPEHALLYTPDTYLAIQAGLDVPPGLEMGPFSFSPGHDRPGLMNFDDIQQALHASDAVAFSTYQFLASPAIRPFTDEEIARFRHLVQQTHHLLIIEPDFGQAQTPLEIYLRNSPHPENL